jgi:hypothetical protein
MKMYGQLHVWVALDSLTPTEAKPLQALDTRLGWAPQPVRMKGKEPITCHEGTEED